MSKPTAVDEAAGTAAQASHPGPGMGGLIIFLIIACGLLLLSRQMMTPEVLHGGDQLWQLSLDVSFRAQQNQTLVAVSTPYADRHHQLVRQVVDHPGLRMRYLKTPDASRHAINAVAQRDGPVAISVDFYVQQSAEPLLQFSRPELSAGQQQLYLTPSPEINHRLFRDLLDALNNQTVDEMERVQWLYDYIRSLHPARNQPPENLLRVLQTESASARQRAELFVALARAVNIPARMVTGFVLQEATDPRPHHWLQLWREDQWQNIDPTLGYLGELPENYLAMRYNSAQLVTLNQGEQLNIEYHLQQADDTTITSQTRHKQPSNIFDLSRLDFTTRTALASLMLLPLGVLITALFRHLAGVHSYGVFTPTLLALAVTHNQWQTSATIVGVIVLFSLLGRKIFPRKMSRTPRLSIIFTLVAVSMAMGVSVIDYVTPSPDGYAVLLPIVILTSLIDRFFSTLDDKGVRIAYTRLLWTLIITLACLPLVQYRDLGYVLVNYPELHLLTLAAILFLGSYKGRTLVAWLPMALREPAPKKSAARESDEGL